jgi:hypothetical protein
LNPSIASTPLFPAMMPRSETVVLFSAERCGDKRPHAVRDFLEIAERFAGNDCTQRPPRPRVSQCVRHRGGGKREMCGA